MSGDWSSSVSVVLTDYGCEVIADVAEAERAEMVRELRKAADELEAMPSPVVN